MENKFKCPYCGQSEYTNTSSKVGSFINWIAVRGHTSRCIKNIGTYIITEKYGPIHYTEFLNKSLNILKVEYPNIAYADYLQIFKKRNIITKSFTIRKVYTEAEVIYAVQDFYKKHNRIPQARDFDQIKEYPSFKVIRRLFRTWNRAIAASGYKPNVQNGYGIDTYGLDKHLYRSQAEAYFADTFLYSKFDYKIEPPYPNRWDYDWYIPELDLYIELDGEIRPERIKEKIELNKQLNRDCLVVKTRDIYNNKYNILEDFICR